MYGGHHPVSVRFGPPLRLYLAEELVDGEPLSSRIGINEAEGPIVARQLLKRPVSVGSVRYRDRWEGTGCGFRGSSGTSTIVLTSASTSDVPSKTPRTCCTRATIPLACSRNRRRQVENRGSCFKVVLAWGGL